MVMKEAYQQSSVFIHMYTSRYGSAHLQLTFNRKENNATDLNNLRVQTNKISSQSQTLEVTACVATTPLTRTFDELLRKL